MEENRFPIGEFKEVKDPRKDDIHTWILEIQRIPQLLKDTLALFTEEELKLTYRPGGWTIRQIVHHIADNDMNVYFRFKRTLTEEKPILPSYEQERWAEMADYEEPIEVSLQIITAVYRRLTALLINIKADQWKRTMTSLTFGEMNLETVMQRFLWHDKHHIAQIGGIRRGRQ